MINNASITDWRTKAPWRNDVQVEQDLIISRAIIEIFSESMLSGELAFRGGTALQKIFYKQPTRYSEDLDFVQIKPGGIGKIIDALRSKLDPWLGTPNRKLNEGRVTLFYKYEASGPARTKKKLKIEINSREHFSVLGLDAKYFMMQNPWYSGETKVTTYYLEELLGTKLRALFQRKKGRDLFDLAISIKELKPDEKKIIKCFMHYMNEMGLMVSRAEFEENLEYKGNDPAFVGDILPLLSEPRNSEAEFYNDLNLVKEKLISLLPGEPWKGAKLLPLEAETAD